MINNIHHSSNKSRNGLTKCRGFKFVSPIANSSTIIECTELQRKVGRNGMVFHALPANYPTTCLGPTILRACMSIEQIMLP